MIKYVIKNMKDDCREGLHMVVILRGDELVGIPARGLSYNESVRFLDNFRYAFEFGHKAAMKEIFQFGLEGREFKSKHIEEL